MKLESQVCNLDLSKRLKELGVKQESEFNWYWHKWPEHPNSWPGPKKPVDGFELIFGKPPGNYSGEKWLGGKMYSAFTVAELGEILPPTVMIDYAQCVLNIGPSGPSNEFWCVSFIGIQHCHRRLDFAADSEANARAKMLIYLIENKLVKASIQMTAGRMEE